MRLTHCSVRNFRSITEAQNFDVNRSTALVGQNESGKTNILLALEYMGNEQVPPEGDLPFAYTIPPDEVESWFVATKWELSDDEVATANKLVGLPLKQRSLWIYRYHGKSSRYYQTTGIPAASDYATRAVTACTELAASLHASPDLQDARRLLLNVAEHIRGNVDDEKKWSARITPSISTIKERLDQMSLSLAQRRRLAAVSAVMNQIDKSRTAVAKAVTYLSSIFPKFVYVDDYPDPVGRQNLQEYAERIEAKKPDESDERFERLMRIGELDRADLLSLKNLSRQMRARKLTEAALKVTRAFRRWWPNQAIEISFSCDAGEVDTIVSERLADDCVVSVNLDDRSKGFRWFFGFFISYAEASDDGKPPIALLDEPGLHLHASSQKQLLSFLERSFRASVIYSTHSPYMVDPGRLQDVRLVERSTTGSTVVRDGLWGDRASLDPLRAALGVSLAQSIFASDVAVLVEGITDYWLLSATSDRLNSADSTGLKEGYTVINSGASSKITLMAAFLGSEDVRCVAVFDSEPDAAREADLLIKRKLVRSDAVLFVGDYFEEPQSEADIEDLIGSSLYQKYVTEAYGVEFVRTLTLDERLPRIARRYQSAFESSGVTFSKARVAKLIAESIWSGDEVLAPETLDRFRRLFKAINEAVTRIRNKTVFEAPK